MEKHTVIENLDLQTHDSNSSTAGGQSGKGFVEDGSNSSQTTEKKPSKLRQLIRNYGEELVKYIDDTLGAYIPALKRAANKMSTATSEQQAAEVPDANWWTILIVGYILHKVLMPVRLGITAAVTPYLARRAQKMGWSWLVSKRSILKERHMH
ncbi:hypothetical protein EV182_001673 [Spiromyces aspiralis]|uniref:Uncharacterized protein n=1 Tax=Spiromyces aspiralis TaxID=68401 RepID=A0ACC1HJD1_9FUNG|nr:hypothetical protein EV182_001673 [Spiromyces aspiralis]